MAAPAETQSFFPNVQRLLRRIIPLICIGVLANLAFSWYAYGRGQEAGWSHFSAGYLMVAALLALLPWFWHILRLLIWGKFFGVPVSWKNALRTVVATDVGGSLAPQAIGGAPVKIAMLVEQGFTTGQATSLTLMNSVEEVVFFGLLIPTTLVLTRSWTNPLWTHFTGFLKNNVWLAPALLILFVAPLLLLKISARVRRTARRLFGRWKHLEADFRQAARLIRQNGRKPFLFSMLALSAQWATRFAILVAVLLALGIADHLGRMFWLQWMVFVAMVFVPTPGATGGAEAAFLLVFGRLIPETLLGPAMAGWRFMTYYFMLLIGVGVLWILQKKSGGNPVT